jgi:hypothetical protein
MWCDSNGKARVKVGKKGDYSRDDATNATEFKAFDDIPMTNKQFDKPFFLAAA